jgi:hypothetical protein
MDLPEDKNGQTHAISIPNLDNLFVCADNQAVSGHLCATLYPGYPLHGQSVSLIFQGKRPPGPDVVEQSMTCGGANGVGKSIGPRSQSGNGQPRAVITINARKYRPGGRPERDKTRTRQREDAQTAPRSWIPKLNRSVSVDPKRPQSVGWIYVDGIHAGNGARVTITSAVRSSAAAEDEGSQVTPLLQVKTIHLVAGCTEERITGRKVISKRATKARYPRAVIKATLRVQLDCAVSLQMQCLCPVIGKNL